MNDKLDSVLHTIYIRASTLSDTDKRNLVKALDYFARILRADDGERSMSDNLIRVNRYFSRFNPSRSNQTDKSSKDLLDFARSNSHGKWNFSKADLKALQAPFWKALESNAEVWSPRELSNLLSYSLRQSIHIDFDEDTTSKTVARLYHEYFRSLEQSERDHVFEELMQRVLSEPEFRHSLAYKDQRK
jgi:hypothetical protein